MNMSTFTSLSLSVCKSVPKLAILTIRLPLHYQLSGFGFLG